MENRKFEAEYRKVLEHLHCKCRCQANGVDEGTNFTNSGFPDQILRITVNLDELRWTAVKWSYEWNSKQEMTNISALNISFLEIYCKLKIQHDGIVGK